MYPIFPWPIYRLVVCQSSGIGEQNHTHAGTINIDLLGSGGLVIQEQNTVIDVESGLLLLGASAAGPLVRQTSEDAALSGVESSVLNTAPGVDGNDTEGLGLGGRGSRGNGADTGGEGEVLKLHFGGGRWLVDVVGNMGSGLRQINDF